MYPDWNGNGFPRLPGMTGGAIATLQSSCERNGLARECRQIESPSAEGPVSVIPACAGIQNPLLEQNDSVTGTRGFPRLPGMTA